MIDFRDNFNALTFELKFPTTHSIERYENQLSLTQRRLRKQIKTKHLNSLNFDRILFHFFIVDHLTSTHLKTEEITQWISQSMRYEKVSIANFFHHRCILSRKVR